MKKEAGTDVLGQEWSREMKRTRGKMKAVRPGMQQRY